MSEEKKALSHQAFGIYKSPKTGEWVVAVLDYDPIAGVVGSITEISTGGVRDMAIERFKIEAGHMLYK